MSLKALENKEELKKIIDEESISNIKDNTLSDSEVINDIEKNEDNDLIQQLKQELIDWWNTYIFVKNISKYYWVEWKRFFGKWEVCENINQPSKNITYFRENNIIPTYKDISYFNWERDWIYNLFDIRTLTNKSNKPILDKNIEYLVSNLCWWNKESIEYLHQAVLYKYTHLNDVRIPAVVFYWAWWSWKWTFLKLLGKMFWDDNVLSNLWKQDLTSQFSPFRWDKLIVSFDEIVTNSNQEDTNITNKLKNLIFAEKIVVNQKYVNTYPFDNIAWFFVSSNNNLPIKLDDKSVWNRRFSVFYTSESLKNTDEIYKAINDKTVVSNYIAWLFKTYPEVVNWTKIESLENDDKRELEFTSQNEANIFWDWFEVNYPNLHWKVNKNTIAKCIDEYLNKNEEVDSKEFVRYFWRNSRYMKKRFRENWRLVYWALIPKNEDLINSKKKLDIDDKKRLEEHWFWNSNIHWTNEEWQIVEYSVDGWEKIVDDMRDLKMDLSKM